MVVYTLTGTSFKGSIIERFNRTLKTRIARYMTENNTTRWIDALPGITAAYNKAYHRSIKMTPHEASRLENRSKVFDNLYPARKMKRLCSLQRGQKVRIQVKRGVFTKGYNVGWSEEIYEIVKVDLVSHHCYCLFCNMIFR